MTSTTMTRCVVCPQIKLKEQYKWTKWTAVVLGLAFRCFPDCRQGGERVGKMISCGIIPAVYMYFIFCTIVSESQGQSVVSKPSWSQSVRWSRVHLSLAPSLHTTTFNGLWAFPSVTTCTQMPLCTETRNATRLNVTISLNVLGLVEHSKDR